MTTPATPVVNKAVVGDPTKAAMNTATSPQAFKITGFDDDADDIQRLNMIAYGPYGSGKTTLMATAADVEAMQDVLMIDIESGKLSIKDSDRIKNKNKIDVVRVTNFRQMGQVHDNFLKPHIKLRDDFSEAATLKLRELEAKFKGVPVERIKVPKRYNTVIVDSLTELDKIVTYELLGFSTTGTLGDLIKDNDMEVAEFKEYKQNNQMMQLIVRAFRDLDINTLFVVQEAYVQDELKRMLYSPALTGKLGKQVQGMVDIVAYLQVGTPKEGEKSAPRRLQLQPATRFDAKNRMAGFKESFIDDPNMSKIWSELEG
jgi:hypothetical protein